jgi:hypothetical protein
MALPEELRAGQQNLLASGSFEIRESCSRVTPVPPVSWEVPRGPGKAADYWARIRRHQAQGDLARYGYFSGMQLQASRPIVFGLDSSCLPHESQ